jgi:hypothetical protein
MRLSLIPWTCGVVAFVAAPALGQPRLPARAFQPSLAAVAPSPAPPVTEWWRNGGPRIRPTDDRAAALLLNGLERSARLRALADTIDAAHVVVYLTVDPRVDAGLAGRLTFMGNAGRYRYVRVAVNPRLSGDVLIATLAHELQHVVEVIEHPDVTSERSLGKLYERIGRSTRVGGIQGWETSAAQEVTYEVRRELSNAEVAAVARQETPRQPSRGDGPGQRQDHF